MGKWRIENRVCLNLFLYLCYITFLYKYFIKEKSIIFYNKISNPEQRTQKRKKEKKKKKKINVRRKESRKKREFIVAINLEKEKRKKKVQEFNVAKNLEFDIAKKKTL